MLGWLCAWPRSESLLIGALRAERIRACEKCEILSRWLVEMAAALLAGLFSSVLEKGEAIAMAVFGIIPTKSCCDDARDLLDCTIRSPRRPDNNQTLRSVGVDHWPFDRA